MLLSFPFIDFFTLSLNPFLLKGVLTFFRLSRQSYEAASFSTFSRQTISNTVFSRTSIFWVVCSHPDYQYQLKQNLATFGVSIPNLNFGILCWWKKDITKRMNNIKKLIIPKLFSCYKTIQYCEKRCKVDMKDGMLPRPDHNFDHNTTEPKYICQEQSSSKLFCCLLILVKIYQTFSFCYSNSKTVRNIWF